MEAPRIVDVSFSMGNSVLESWGALSHLVFARVVMLCLHHALAVFIHPRYALGMNLIEIGGRGSGGVQRVLRSKSAFRRDFRELYAYIHISIGN